LASKNIKVIVVNPGHILTADGVWWKKKQKSPQDFDKFVAQNIPTRKIGKEENVAEMVFSCVNQNLDAFFTGQSLTIDGGTSLLQ
jgi:NAD(P)-dependent dehydrogenase (short-subunit alcohol dehydrogenase family)